MQQPLHLSFDERGRLWVVQYIQYPDPAGIREVSRDKVWRVVYDRVPPPPPHPPGSPFRGKDRITIHEDTDGDGKFDRHKVFADGLNLATSVAHGRGGVWVTNPPYLLFYPDADCDDVPDGPPVVHLKGFGLEDTHSVASSLRWGPDGWLYGAQGSTVSAAVLRPGIDQGDADAVKSMGQNVWRYHPERKIYEVFAEGGGNTFGVEIDSQGRVFSGHNGGDTRGFHYVQGGFYQKTFGKHGELSNPYSFGYFPAMKHAQVARFVHQFIIYEGDGLPDRFLGRLLGVDVLHNNLVLSEMKRLGSTFETVDLERPVASPDVNFRPVHVVEAPDGSVFVADWYDQQVNHYRNHEGQIDHEMGRVYRVRTKGHKPGMPPMDLGRMSSEVLVALLQSPSRWQRQTALRLLGDRHEPDLAEGLKELVTGETGTVALEALWALAQSGGMDEAFGLATMRHESPQLRLWAVRLLEDHGLFSDDVARAVRVMAISDPDLDVLSQIACTAKRVGGEHGLAIANGLAGRSDLADDPHLPLLIWWAIEACLRQIPDKVIDVVAGKKFAAPADLAGFVMKRSAMVGRREDLERCAKLLRLEPDSRSREQLLARLEEGLAGRPLAGLPPSLEAELAKSPGWASLPIRLRQGVPGALGEALASVRGGELSVARRGTLIAALGELGQDADKIVPVLLDLGSEGGDATLRAAAIAALASFERPEIASRMLSAYSQSPAGVRAAALDLLTARSSWGMQLVEAVRSGQIDRQSISLAHLEKLKQFGGALADSVDQLWPEVAPTAGDRAALRRELERVQGIITSGGGVPKRGEALFTQRCAACHTMFNNGGAVGPDLTSYQKNDLETMILSVTDPSAEIREGFEQAVVKLEDGAVHSGFLAEQDDEMVALRELSGAQRRLRRSDIRELDIVGTSLMPPGLLAGLDETQLRDLFAYLRSTTPPF